MKFRKVFYHDGDNSKHDYLILAEKNQVELKKGMLSYDLDSTDKTSFIIKLPSIEGNFDYVLEKRTKNGEFKGLVFCTVEDIEFL